MDKELTTILIPIVCSVLTGVITGVITAIISIYKLKRSFSDNIKLYRHETEILFRRKEYEKTLDALQKCWSLLIYTTDNENSSSILLYKEELHEGKKQRKYSFNKNNIKIYRDKLREMFFAQGWGIYLSTDIKKLLFEYERIVFGLKLSESNNIENKIAFKKQEVAEQMLLIHNQLIKQIKHQKNNIFHQIKEETNKEYFEIKEKE